jgi:hypothetical protein
MHVQTSGIQRTTLRSQASDVTQPDFHAVPRTRPRQLSGEHSPETGALEPIPPRQANEQSLLRGVAPVTGAQKP